MELQEMLDKCPAGFALRRYAGDKWGWVYAGEASIGLSSPQEAVSKFLYWWGKYGAN